MTDIAKLKEELGVLVQRYTDELTILLNRHSLENGSDTPDFILAGYLMSCLESYNAAITAREAWYGRPLPQMPLPQVGADEEQCCGGDCSARGPDA